MLALGREHVYYRSGHPSCLKAPGRILWYLTKDHTTGPGRFIGTSLLDAIDVGTPEELYVSLAHYGVFALRDVRDAADGLGQVQALRLSYTEMFRRPVLWTNYIKLPGGAAGPRKIQAPVGMPRAGFDAVYAMGNS